MQPGNQTLNSEKSIMDILMWIREKVTVMTLTPVFPKTCPGCDRPATSSDIVSGVERGREIGLGMIGMAHLAKAFAYTLDVPMCAACAKQRKRIFWIMMAAFLPVMILFGVAQAAIGAWTVIPLAVLLIYGTVWLLRSFPVRIANMSRTGLQFIEFSAQSPKWMAELVRLNAPIPPKK